MNHGHKESIKSSKITSVGSIPRSCYGRKGKSSLRKGVNGIFERKKNTLRAKWESPGRRWLYFVALRTTSTESERRLTMELSGRRGKSQDQSGLIHWVESENTNSGHMMRQKIGKAGNKKRDECTVRRKGEPQFGKKISGGDCGPGKIP